MIDFNEKKGFIASRTDSSSKASFSVIRVVTDIAHREDIWR